ncbi:MAG: carboxypeptidase regulatory-like domain-containing protein [Spirochaetales bacterium]|nr:carboxypeptidase regulatory-like domain-containing protein [Spirochaetales bacterium]
MKMYKVIFKACRVFAFAVAFFALSGCPDNSSQLNQQGDLEGVAQFINQTSHSGIIVALETTDGVKSEPVAAMIAGREQPTFRGIADQTSTDADGAYAFYGLEPGNYTVYASSPDSVEKAVAINVQVTAGQKATADDLLLTPTGKITGKATLAGSATGNLGILVFIAGTSYSAMTTDTGDYCITDVPAGTGYVLVASKTGYNSVTRGVNVTAGASASVAVMNLSLSTTPVTTGSVSGKVTLGGLPRWNTGIFVYLDGTSYITMTSDSGAYTIPNVDPNTYTLVARKEGYQSASTSVTVSAGKTASAAALTLTAEMAVTTFAGSLGIYGSADDTGNAARFCYPSAIAVSGSNLYVADQSNHTIRKITIGKGEVTTVAGSPGLSGSMDGTGSDARFFGPYGITCVGNTLYVADTNNHTIRKVIAGTGVVTTFAGTAGASGSADGTGTAARFNMPFGLTNDGTNLYVADSFNHVIRKITISGAVVSTLAGSAGSYGSEDGVWTGARFHTPRSLVTDGTNLYVTDTYNHTIRKIDIAYAVVTTLVGAAGSKGFVDGIGTSVLFNYPCGIAGDADTLYVTDTTNHIVRKIDVLTRTVTTIAGRAGQNAGLDGIGSGARFNSPIGLVLYGSGLYVTDRQNHAIRKLWF